MRAAILVLALFAAGLHAQSVGNSGAFRAVASFKRSAATAPPPVAGYVLWVAPESSAFTDRLGVTNAGSGQPVLRWDDLSGFGNHLYKAPVATANEGCHFDSAYTLNGLRIMQFGRDAGAGAQNNRTGLFTSNNIALTAGFTMFAVASFLPAITLAESAGVLFGYAPADRLVFREYHVPNPRYFATYNNQNGVQLFDSVVMGNSNYQFYAWSFSTAASAFWRSNSITSSSATAGTIPVTTNLSIGCRLDDAIASHINAGIPEFILYTNALTTSQISNVNVYLKNKYGL